MQARKPKNILLTGGAGFIGSNTVRMFVKKYPQYSFVNLDDLTYAGNLANLKEIENSANYTFVKGDINDEKFIFSLFDKHRFDTVIHLAAESHVDRSIAEPTLFIMTNIVGTVNLLNAARNLWKNDFSGKIFYHISTDEVYGSLGETGKFSESTPYDPRSPYSASKASSDHLVRAYFHTYHLPVVISNCSNNYGPYQFPEKLIPLAIHNIKNNKAIPVYGKGENVRDWLHVEDHSQAMDIIVHHGKPGETYNIGGDNEWKNIDLIHLLCSVMDKQLGRTEGTSAKLIEFVKDRSGHDLRYAIDSKKIREELGWKPETDFKTGLENTVKWYLSNEEWLRGVTSGEYQNYYKKQYAER